MGSVVSCRGTSPTKLSGHEDASPNKPGGFGCPDIDIDLFAKRQVETIGLLARPIIVLISNRRPGDLLIHAALVASARMGSSR